MGLFDSIAASPELQQGLLQAGLATMAAGPGRSFGQALGMGGLQGLQGYQQAQMQAPDLRMKKMQAQQLEQAMKDQAGAQAWMQNARNPVGQAMGQGAAQGDVGPTMGNAARLEQAPPQSNMDMINGMINSGNPVLIKQAHDLAATLKASQPKFATEPRVVMGPEGKPVLVQMAEDGTVRQMDFAPAEKLNFQNTGGQTMALDPYTGKPVNTIANTMTPDAVASNAVARGNLGVAQGNLGLSRQRFNFEQGQAAKPQFKDGYWITPPSATAPNGTIIETPLSAAPKGSEREAAQSAGRVLPLIDQADALLNDATGSLYGATRDALVGTVGVSTKGSQNAAKLKVLQGKLMMNQPRMEGPQSDADTALYKEMAGQIGDRTVPVETRRAALQELRRLHDKYAPAKSPVSGWSATIVP